MLGVDLLRAIDDMAGGNMAPCLATAMRTTQTAQCCYENRCGQSGIDLGLVREHDAHETELGRVCEFD